MKRKIKPAILIAIPACLFVASMTLALKSRPEAERAMSAPSSTLKPNLVSTDATYRAEGVALGEKVEHRFQIRNISGQRVRLKLGPPSCGCTRADVEQIALEPGEETGVLMRAETIGKHGLVKVNVPLIADLFAPGATTASPPAAEQVALLEMDLNMDERYGVFPSPMGLQQAVRGHGEQDNPFTIACGDPGTTLQSATLDPPADYLSLTIAAQQDAATAKAWKGNVRVDAAKLPPGVKEISSKLIVRLTTQRGPQTFEVPISGAIEELVAASPGFLYWNYDTSGQKQVIQFTSHDNKPVVLNEIKCSDQDLVGSELVPNSDPPTIHVWQKAHARESRVLRTSVVATLSHDGVRRVITVPIVIMPTSRS
jgi:hypothetical protein